LATPQAITLTPGWNLVAAPYPAGALSSDRIWNEIVAQGGSVSEIVAYDSSQGAYQTYIAGSTPPFTIPSMAGFWVLASAASTWTPMP
jgi:hypothetical protein